MLELSEIFETLNKANIRYLLCGGLAVNIFGIPRMTADIDLIVDFEENNLREFHTQITRLHFQSNIPVPVIQLAKTEHREELLKTKNLIAYSYFNTQVNMAHVDVLVDVPIDFETLWVNKEIRKFVTADVYIVSVSDLILLKKYSDRLQDKEDIILLSKMYPNEKRNHS